jgi:hypothetical protein
MWLTKKLEQWADKLEARQKARKKERRILAEAKRDRDLSPTEREKVIQDVKREYELALKRWEPAFRIALGSFIGSAAVCTLLYHYFPRDWALLLAWVPLSVSFALLGLEVFKIWEMHEVYSAMWKHLGVQFDDPSTPKESPPATRPNTENPPPVIQKFGPKQVMAYAFIFISFSIAGLAVWLYVTDVVALVALLSLITIPAVYALDAVGKKKAGEPLPLVSWPCELKAGGHTIELAFQMPPEYKTPQTQERIVVATRVILRNFNAETLQDTLETGLFKDVRELKIPVFRIQILAIDKVAVPVPAPVKEKEKSVYI